MERKNKKTPLVFRVGVILLCFALVSFHMVSNGLYARYSTNAGGSVGTKIAYAVVEVSYEESDGENVIGSGEQYEYELTVTNQKNGQVSEVALEYTIYVEVPETIVLDVSVSDATKIGEETTGTLAFKANAPLRAGVSESVVHTVTVQGGDATVGSHENVGITVRVKAEQVD